MQEHNKQTCCDCKHFRMWKPKPMYCTKQKQVVGPLTENCKCHVVRKGLVYV